MPELPEVETVARDLGPRIVGATITGARASWARTLRTHTPEAFAEAVAGREVLGVGRRGKQVVIELSDGRELRFRDIRKFGRIGLYGRDPVTGELVAEVGGTAVFGAIGPEPL